MMTPSNPTEVIYTEYINSFIKHQNSIIQKLPSLFIIKFEKAEDGSISAAINSNKFYVHGF